MEINVKDAGIVPYNKYTLKNKIEDLFRTNKFEDLNLSNEDNFFMIVTSKDTIKFSSRISREVVNKIQIDQIIEQLSTFFQICQGRVGFVCSSLDYYWQNNEDPKDYERKGKSLEGVVLKQDPLFRSRQIVDVEMLPGHSHNKFDSWFGSCWTMFFGLSYFQFIPSDVLLSFKDGYETVHFPNGAIRIKLYQDVWDYEDPQNRLIQWNFRRSVGMDEIAHGLKQKNKY